MRNSELRTRNALLVAVLTCLLSASPLAAQTGGDTLLIRSSPFLVKYGKWAILAASIGMGLKASQAHHAADRAYSRLEDYCFADRTRCDQAAGGSYVDPVAEGYFQSALHGDRRARRWLVGGEVALIGTAGLFVWELTRPKSLPKNIPFEPTLQVGPTTTQVGLRLEF